MWRLIKKYYYRRKARRLIMMIEKGYLALHLLLKKAGYPRSERRRIVKDIVKNRGILDRYLIEEKKNI